MRLPKSLQQQLIQHIRNSFGSVNIYLFGSRTDDSKHGGDIDIAIEVACSPENFKQMKIQLLTSLARVGFDFKVDIVQYPNTDNLLTQEIKNNAIKL